MPAAIVIIISFIWLLCLPAVAYAYVDPSVMTYTIQALAGVAVALSALIGVAFRRVRRRIFTLFNIDENSYKAHEGKINGINPESPYASKEFEVADKRALELQLNSAKTSEDRAIENLTWKKRFAFVLFSCIFVFYIVFIAPGIEIFGANADSLIFSLSNVWWITVFFNVLLSIVCALALTALKGENFLTALLIVFSLGIASYVQTFFLNSGMMPADGGYIGWTEWYFVQKMIVSGLVWVAIFLLPQFLGKKNRYSWIKGASIFAVAIVIMQSAGLVSVLTDNKEFLGDKDRPYVTQGDLFTVNPKNNVIVFVLDTYDTAILDRALKDDPQLLDNFTDFTYFRNSSGTMIPTSYAIPYILSGAKPKPDEKIEDYLKRRYTGKTLLSTVNDADYTIGLYTDSTMFDYTNPADAALAKSTLNIHPLKNLPLDIWQTFLVMNQCALYREAPWVAKPLFWYYTTEINNRMIADAGSSNGNDELYSIDDAAILKELKKNGISPTDIKSKGAFRFIHLFGPHFPFSVDENGNNVGVGNSDKERQARGSMKVVDEYLSQLKQLGLYDQATIIVTADHGEWSDREDPPKHAISPIMLVKPSLTQEESGKPYVISMAPVDHDDILSTIASALGVDPTQLGSGITVWQANDFRPRRTFHAITSVGDHGRRMVEYEIEEDALNLKDWKKTGKEWSDS